MDIGHVLLMSTNLLHVLLLVYPPPISGNGIMSNFGLLFMIFSLKITNECSLTLLFLREM